MTIIEMLRLCGNSICKAADEIERLNSINVHSGKRLARAEDTILDFARRAECWSSVDIIAHVADYFGATVKELEAQIETDQ